MAYCGNVYLQLTLSKLVQIFDGIYAKIANNLSIRDFNLSWNNDLPAFFTNGIECLEVKDLLINDFVGAANPNAPGSQKIELQNLAYRK